MEKKSKCKYGHLLDGVRSTGKRFCKTCNREAKKRAYDADPEKYRKRSKEFKKREPEKVKAWAKRYQELNKDVVKNRYLVWRYGITLEQYDAKVVEQNRACAICEEQKPLEVDHSHVTGENRGLLCTNCNTGIGQFKDSVAKLHKAIQYLESYQ